MTSIVVHYKELALKGRNRPWFIQILVRNLKTALAGLHVRVGSIDHGPHRDRAGGRPESQPIRVERSARSRAPRVRHRELFVRRPRAARLRRARVGDPRRSRRSSGGLVPRRRRRAPTSGCRSRRREVEREVGGRIKEAKGWRVDLDHPALTIHLEMLPDGRVLLFRQGAWRRRTADRNRRARRVSAVGRHRFAGRGVSHDAARLLGAVRFTFTAIRSCRARRRRRCARSRRC